ncbi:MAG: cytochrome bc complex cytochrome b subunit [Syntrophorhabdales bacterium]|jgi:cytochrome b6
MWRRRRLGIKRWFDERYDLADMRAMAGRKLVPVHSRGIWYYTGGIALFLLIIQFLTGMALAFYYVPSPEKAHKDIIDIVTKLNMGWFFRSLHHWGGQLAILALLVHVFATLLLKSYRKPRELMWVSGLLLFGIAIFFGLSGYFLLWDERAFAAVRVATGGAGNLPLFGPWIKAFLRGGIDVTEETLTRFYAFHVSVLPLLTLVIASLHLLLVQFHGMSIPLSQKGKNLKQVPFFPNVLYRDFMIWLVVLGVVVTLATLLPPEIGKIADPLAPPPENVKPEWYFLFLFQTLKLFPGSLAGMNGETIAIVLVALAILFFFLVPFLDRRSAAERRSPLFTLIGVGYLLYFIVMTIVGYFS